MNGEAIELSPLAKAAVAHARADVAFTGEIAASVRGLAYHGLAFVDDEPPRFISYPTLAGLKRWLDKLIVEVEQKEAYVYTFYGTFFRVTKGKPRMLIASDFSAGIVVDGSAENKELSKEDLQGIQLVDLSSGFIGAPWFDGEPPVADDTDAAVSDDEGVIDDSDAPPPPPYVGAEDDADEDLAEDDD